MLTWQNTFHTVWSPTSKSATFRTDITLPYICTGGMGGELFKLLTWCQWGDVEISHFIIIIIWFSTPSTVPNQLTLWQSTQTWSIQCIQCKIMKNNSYTKLWRWQPQHHKQTQQHTMTSNQPHIPTHHHQIIITSHHTYDYPDHINLTNTIPKILTLPPPLLHFTSCFSP